MIAMGKELAIVFLDAQKAFDNIDWNFMFIQLEIMETGLDSMNWIRAIYKHQEVRIRVNGGLTEKIEINKGTRQGCPLSPLLFILTLEVLNNVIRAEREIKGVRVRDEEFKILVFADDMVSMVEQPETSLKILMTKIAEYGSMAGLKINWEKTKMIVKNINAKKVKKLEELTTIAVVNKVKYLGIILIRVAR